jgi:hypothetical protein
MFISDNIVNTMTMLMVAMIGPIELSANTLNKNARDATVVNATAANPNAAMYLQKISSCEI